MDRLLLYVLRTGHVDDPAVLLFFIVQILLADRRLSGFRLSE